MHRCAWRGGGAQRAGLCCPWRLNRRLCALSSDRIWRGFCASGIHEQIDVKQAVFKARAGHMDVIRELEAALEQQAAIP